MKRVTSDVDEETFQCFSKKCIDSNDLIGGLAREEVFLFLSEKGG